MERTYQSVVTYIYGNVYMYRSERDTSEKISVFLTVRKAALCVSGPLNVDCRIFYAQICNYETSVGQDTRYGDMSSGLVCCLIRDTL